MIVRYTLPEMGLIWSEESEFEAMLKVEIYAAEAMMKLGIVPQEALEDIQKKASFSVVRIREIEQETRHDILAFLQNVSENVGESSKYIHLGLTSTDVKDTALSYLLLKATNIIEEDLEKLKAILFRRAHEHKYTVMVGRTHGIHAEPTTFGLKLFLWFDEIERNLKRIKAAKKSIAVGKISGAVGTYAFVDPFVEKYVCEKMGLEPAKISTQVLQRDRHAELLNVLAIVAGTIEKFAIEIRSLQRTDIREVEEYFHKGQKGSSAMPHKRNPITCERLSGLARVVRGNALAAMENMALWHERDISHSSVERIILPDSMIVLDNMLQTFANVAENLLVYPEAMLKNIDKTKGLIYSQQVLLALIGKGVMRGEAYSLVQENAMLCWESSADFKELLLKDEKIKQFLTKQELENCFKPSTYLKYVDKIAERFVI